MVLFHWTFVGCMNLLALLPQHSQVGQVVQTQNTHIQIKGKIIFDILKFFLVLIPMVSISFREHKRKEKIKNDLPVINRISWNIGNKPMPKLRQCSINQILNQVDNFSITNLFLLELMSRLLRTMVYRLSGCAGHFNMGLNLKVSN